MDDEPLKIVFLGDHWGRGGGTRGQMWAAAHGLRDKGHEVCVYAESRGGTPSPGVAFRALPAGRSTAAQRAREQLVAGLIVGGHRLVHSWIRVPGAPIFRAGGGAHAAWLRARGPRSAIGRIFDGSDRRETSIDRDCCVRAQVVICNSQLGARDVQRSYGPLAARARVVRNGVDLQLFSALRGDRPSHLPPSEGRVAIFVGRGARRKGLFTAGEAFLLAANQHDQLWVVGEDSGRARRRMTRLVGGRLRWMGPRSDLELILPWADALVLPTRYDSSANVVLEALACGVPTVTTSMDGASEIVPDRRLIVTDPTDVRGVADALSYAWSCRGARRWRSAAKEWPVSRMVDALEALYTEWWHD